MKNKQTSRLYIGTGATTALPVNSNIVVVNSVSDLEESTSAGYQNPSLFNDGDFAYVTTGNILAVKQGNSWTQVNGVDKSKIWKDFTPSISTSNGTATISWALRNENNAALKDANGNTPSITMDGANGITVSNSGNALTVTGTAYEIHSPAVVADSNAATLKIQSKSSATGSLTDVSSIGISAGESGNIQITGAADSIVIDAKDTHLTENSVSVANHATAGFNIQVKDNYNGGNAAQLDPKITLGTHTATADEYHFVAGVANLPVYTKDEVDGLLNDVDAMTYKGLVTEAGLGNQTSGLHIGDTYKASEGFSLDSTHTTTGGSVTVKPGDLLIVSSQNTEGADGTISGNAIKYDVIPSGDDFYVFKGLGANNQGNGIQIEDGHNGVLSSIEIAAGNQVAVSSAHSDNNSGDGAKAVVTVAHGTISASTNGNANTIAAGVTPDHAQSKHQDLEFDVVTGLTTNNGHVTGTTVERIKVVDTVAQLDTANTNVAVTAPASGQTDYQKAATVTSSIALKDENNAPINDADLAFTLRSDNLKITTSGSTITANYVWGQF